MFKRFKSPFESKANEITNHSPEHQLPKPSLSTLLGLNKEAVDIETFIMCFLPFTFYLFNLLFHR